MSDEDRRCGTCRWWEPRERTPTGRPRKSVSGRCQFKIELPAMPSCVAQPVYINKLAAWFEDGTNCPCHERKEKSE